MTEALLLLVSLLTGCAYLQKKQIDKLRMDLSIEKSRSKYDREQYQAVEQILADHEDTLSSLYTEENQIRTIFSFIASEENKPHQNN